MCRTLAVKAVTVGLLLSAAVVSTQVASAFSDEHDKKLLIASKTEIFQEKEGFERDRKDIINTLKDNNVDHFSTLLESLKQAFYLDQTLKGKGPYTLLAPTDKAFKHVPEDDSMAMQADKPRLKRVLTYHIVEGKIDSKQLRSLHSLKTLEGHEIPVKELHGNIYVGDSMITTADIPCSNGLIHVLEKVNMLPSDSK